MKDERKVLVARGYDAAAHRYLAWPGGREIRERYLRKLVDLVPKGGSVLDLGCGAGVPVASRLARKASVLGVDISARQIELARENVPAAIFRQGDMVAIRPPREMFDAICAFYSITHVPREQHALLLRRIASWLRPGGVFLASLGVRGAHDAIEKDWLGVPMFFSHFDAVTNSSLIRQAGLRPFHEEIVEHDEDGRSVRFLWVIARKPAA
jgi:SAM-dependent methyltransferase